MGRNCLPVLLDTALPLWPDIENGAMSGVDRVELKLMVSDTDQKELMTALRVRSRGASNRRTYFFDTADLTLARCGLIVRARRNRRGVDDSVVKLRRPGPVSLPRKTRRSSNLGLELDALPGLSIWSASLARRLGRGAVRAVVTGRRPPGTLLSAEQRRFLGAYAEADLSVEELTMHGPIEVTRTPTAIVRAGSRLMVESWIYPDGSRLLEISAKCAPARASRVAAEAGQFLAERGIEPDGTQRTKADASLAYLGWN